MRLALVGAGRMGRRHAANIVAAGHELAAVCDPDPKAAAQVSRLTGARRMELGKMLAAGAAEAVVIASPAAAHAAAAAACVRAGVPFLCEKPLGADLAASRRLAKLAAERGAYGMVSLNRRYDRQFGMLRDGVKKGQVGKVEIVKLVSRSEKVPPLAYVKSSGGLLRDKGAHFFDLACWLTRQLPVAVQATGKRLFCPELAAADDHDTAMITLELADGALCHFDFSRRAPYGQDERVEIMGSKGMLQCSFPPAHACVRVRADGVAEAAAPKSTWQEHYAPTYAAALDAFTASLRRGKPPPIPIGAGLLAELIAAAAARSIASGRRTPVDTAGIDPACVAA
ncbi:MAG: Gfo/Idh/MocA family oxidoreductase [Betaproteobacteria bacterium AqS2]|uniref:Gfo/Idh/MocA family oxidoreductase n=1 Tax=Candidatus Amphirhobacter heronislandensis TaxID=1732024 RepID=A0A930UCQ0_9GAMM|nr:Gfo/Idh/MocA family oxidoreductase [Betaproteobacteria bacterium AqS2]